MNPNEDARLAAAALRSVPDRFAAGVAASPMATALRQGDYQLSYRDLDELASRVAGVEPARVAEWAGNSVPVLLRVYAKCLSGTEQNALRKIQEAEPSPHAEAEHG